MFSWNRGGVWLLRVRDGRISLCVPLPMIVFIDLMDSLEDLCAVILPRLGLPNYAALLRELFEAFDAPPGEPLFAVDAGGTQVSLTRMIAT